MDQVALIEQMRAAAEALLAKGATDQLDQIVKAIQARHTQVMAELTGHVRELPDGVDDQ